MNQRKTRELSADGAGFLRRVEGQTLKPLHVGFTKEWIADLKLPELTDPQYTAFFSLAYQAIYGDCNTIDKEPLQTSKLVQFLQKEQYQLAAGEFDRWAAQGERFDKGLIHRRRMEWELFLHGRFNS